MTNPAKRKGDTAELEAARLIADLTGWPARRALGAGRADDTGDIYGVPDTVIQIKNFVDIGRAVRECLAGLEVQRVNAGATHAAGFIRRRGGGFFVVMTPQQWGTYAREAAA